MNAIQSVLNYFFRENLSNFRGIRRDNVELNRQNLATRSDRQRAYIINELCLWMQICSNVTEGFKT